MLLPREKPFLTDLNSYYLDVEKFIQHLQGEIGSGCLYGKGADQELMVYFDESDIVRGLTQNRGEHAIASERIDHVLAALAKKNFQITVYFLDADSIFFWGQLPAFRRAKEKLPSKKVGLPDLVFRLNKKSFSGFIEIDVNGRTDCAVLFFHQGQRRGGSYCWSTGGLSIADDDYNTLVAMLQKSGGTYSLGYFLNEPLQSAPEISENAPGNEESPGDTQEQRTLTALDEAISAFVRIFLKVAASKNDIEPLMELKLKFIDFVSIYPVLDPYNKVCMLQEDGGVVFANDLAAKEGIEGIVDCAWMVIEEHKLHKKFIAALKNMAEREILEKQGIDLTR